MHTKIFVAEHRLGGEHEYGLAPTPDKKMSLDFSGKCPRGRLKFVLEFLKIAQN